MFIRFRSGLFSFMKRMREKFDIHVVSFGGKEYVNSIVKAINSFENENYINGAVISYDKCDSVVYYQDSDEGKRTFDGDSEKESIKRKKTTYEMGPINMRIAVDDRDDVWDNENVLQLKEWKGFDESYQSELERIGDILLDIHSEFYSEINPIENITELLHQRRKTIFEGKRVFFYRPNFGGLIEDKHLHEELWKKIRDNCEKMGIVLQNEIYIEGENKTDFIVDAEPCFGIPAIKSRYFVECWIWMKELDIDEYIIEEYKNDENVKERYRNVEHCIHEERKREFDENEENDEFESKRNIEKNFCILRWYCFPSTYG